MNVLFNQSNMVIVSSFFWFYIYIMQDFSVNMFVCFFFQYRSLVESETLEYTVKSKFPSKWNGHQDWVLNLTGCKATVWFIYAHKEFFQAMMNDWASKARPDLLHFVPYTWRINLLMKEFEFIMPANEYNWIDCSSQSHENSEPSLYLISVSLIIKTFKLICLFYFSVHSYLWRSI